MQTQFKLNFAGVMFGNSSTKIPHFDTIEQKESQHRQFVVSNVTFSQRAYLPFIFIHFEVNFFKGVKTIENEA